MTGCGRVAYAKPSFRNFALSGREERAIVRTLMFLQKASSSYYSRHRRADPVRALRTSFVLFCPISFTENPLKTTPQKNLKIRKPTVSNSLSTTALTSFRTLTHDLYLPTTSHHLRRRAQLQPAHKDITNPYSSTFSLRYLTRIWYAQSPLNRRMKVSKLSTCTSNAQSVRSIR